MIVSPTFVLRCFFFQVLTDTLKLCCSYIWHNNKHRIDFYKLTLTLMELAFLFFYFEEAVDRYSATGKPICLLGDVNVNILLAQTCNYAQQFLDCLQSYALLPTIDKPTRVCNNSATLIDNIFTNKFSEYFASGNIVSDITDHFSQFCIFQSSIF